MDRQDFEVIVRETWEGIERAIDELALDGVEAYPEEKGMRLMFDDGSAATLTRNDDAMQLDLVTGSYLVPFYYDEGEEAWYAHTDERPLLSVISDVISDKLERRITLPDLI